MGWYQRTLFCQLLNSQCLAQFRGDGQLIVFTRWSEGVNGEREWGEGAAVYFSLLCLSGLPCLLKVCFLHRVSSDFPDLHRHLKRVDLQIYQYSPNFLGFLAMQFHRTVIPIWCKLLEDEKEQISVQFFKQIVYWPLFVKQLLQGTLASEQSLCTKYWQINTCSVAFDYS